MSDNSYTPISKQQEIAAQQLAEMADRMESYAPIIEAAMRAERLRIAAEVLKLATDAPTEVQQWLTNKVALKLQKGEL